MHKVPITTRAVLQRLGRHLAHEEQSIKVCPEKSRWFRDLGRYYLVNTRFNSIETTDVDPIALARELGLLQPWEQAEGEPGDAPPGPDAPVVVPQDAPPFDVHKFWLGSLCKHGHGYRDTGQSLRRLVGGGCEVCAKARQRKAP